MAKMKLTKADIIERIYEDEEIKEYGVSKKEVNIVVSSFVERLRDAIQGLEDQDRIELRGFGTFGIKTRKARMARNPRTGEPVEVPERRSPYFKAGRDLKNAILENNDQNE